MDEPTNMGGSSFGNSAYSFARASEALVGIGSLITRPHHDPSRDSMALLNKILTVLVALKAISAAKGVESPSKRSKASAQGGTEDEEDPQSKGGKRRRRKSRAQESEPEQESRSVIKRSRIPLESARKVDSEQRGQLSEGNINKARGVSVDPKRKAIADDITKESQLPRKKFVPQRGVVVQKKNKPQEELGLSNQRLASTIGVQESDWVQRKRTAAKNAEHEYNRQTEKRFNPIISRLNNWIGEEDEKISAKQEELDRTQNLIRSARNGRSTNASRRFIRDQQRKVGAISDQIDSLKEYRGVFTSAKDRWQGEKDQLKQKASQAHASYQRSIQEDQQSKRNLAAIDSMKSLTGLSYKDGGKSLQALFAFKSGDFPKGGQSFWDTYRRMRAPSEVDKVKSFAGLQRVYKAESSALSNRLSRGDITREEYYASKGRLDKGYDAARRRIVSAKEEKAIVTFGKAVKEFGGKQLSRFSESAGRFKSGFDGVRQVVARGAGKAAKWTFGGGLTSFLGGPWGMALKAGLGIVATGLAIRNSVAKRTIEANEESGRKGTLIRGMGQSFADMARGLSIARRTGVSDDRFLQMVSSMRQRSLGGLFGEGGEQERVGRWGLSIYNENGGLKTAKERLVDESNKLKEIESQYGKNSDMAQKFLQDTGHSVEEADFVRRYAEDSKIRDSAGEDATKNALGENERDARIARIVQRKKQEYQNRMDNALKNGDKDSYLAMAKDWANNMVGLEAEWKFESFQEDKVAQKFETAKKGSRFQNLAWGEKKGLLWGTNRVNADVEDALFGEKDKTGSSLRLNDLLDTTLEGKVAKGSRWRQSNLLTGFVNDFKKEYGKDITAEHLQRFRLNSSDWNTLKPEEQTIDRLRAELNDWLEGNEVGTTAASSVPPSAPVVGASTASSIPPSQPNQMQDKDNQALASMEATQEAAMSAAESANNNGGSQAAMLASNSQPTVIINQNNGGNTFNGSPEENKKNQEQIFAANGKETERSVVAALQMATATC